MVAAENELLQELPYKLWTFEPIAVRAFEHCVHVEDFNYELLPSDNTLRSDKDDWIISSNLVIARGFQDERLFERFAQAMPIRCLNILEAVLSFSENMPELRDLRAWATLRHGKVYPAAMKTIKEAAEDNDAEAIRLALYLLNVEDLGFLKDVTILDLNGEPNAHYWLPKIAGLRYLRSLNLSRSVTPADQLSALSGLDSLQVLDLSNTDVSNADIAKLTALPALRTLNLRDTQVNQGVLPFLEKMRSLQEVDLPFSP